MKKAIFILASLVLLATVFAGCNSINNNGNNQNSTEATYMLTERQIEILKSQGLPTDYEQLNVVQKASIEAIEDMLSYLEKKYPNESFSYEGYVMGNYDNEEHLIARSSTGTVTVYRKNGEFVDDYDLIVAASVYEEAVRDRLLTVIDDNLVMVLARVEELGSAKYDKDSIISSCPFAGVTVFIKEEAGKDKFEEVFQSLTSFFKEEATSNSITIDFYLIKNEKFSEYLLERYGKSFGSGLYTEHKYYHLDEDGEEIIS